MFVKAKQWTAAILAAAAFQAACAQEMSDKVFFKEFLPEFVQAMRQKLLIREPVANGAQIEIRDVRRQGGFLVMEASLDDYRSALPLGDKYTRQDLNDMFRAVAIHQNCLENDVMHEINKHLGLHLSYALPEWRTTVNIVLPKGYCTRLLAEKTPQQIEADSARTVLAVAYREINKLLPAPHGNGLEIYRIELKNDGLHRHFRLLPTADAAKTPQQWQDIMQQKIRRDTCRAAKGRREIAQINRYFPTVDHLEFPDSRESITATLPPNACFDGVVGAGRGNDHYGKAASQP